MKLQHLDTVGLLKHRLNLLIGARGRNATIVFEEPGDHDGYAEFELTMDEIVTIVEERIKQVTLELKELGVEV